MTKTLEEMSNEELWQLFPVVLSSYDPCWPQWFNEEKLLIEKVIGSDVKRISHIGSTAVSGLVAKPTVDILLEIKRSCDTQALSENLRRAGYIFTAQPDNPPPHMMFLKGYTPQGFEPKVFHLHVRYSGDWDELYFRDYLIAHEEVAEQYATLKKRLQLEYKHDRDAYTAAKTDFIQQYTKAARRESGYRYEQNAASIGVIGSADGPTTVFIGREQRNNEWETLLNTCAKLAMPVQQKKTGDELAAFLKQTYGACETKPALNQFFGLKLGALMANQPEWLKVPVMPDEQADKEEWLTWAQQSHHIYLTTAKECPDDKLGYRYMLLDIPYSSKSKALYQARRRESLRDVRQCGLKGWLKALFSPKHIPVIQVELELSTGYFSIQHGPASFIAEIVLWRGVTQKDIDDKNNSFQAYVSAMREIGQISDVKDGNVRQSPNS